MVAIERSGFDLSETISHVLSEMRSDIDAKGLKVSTNGTTTPVPACGDRERVAQVLANLLSNAIRYSPTQAAIEIRVSVPATSSEFIQVDVRDRGPGIPQEHFEKLFDRFYRVDASPARSTGGTGLGLAITKALVELHGGSVWVESSVGEGSTFSFTVPQGSSHRSS